MAVGGIALKKVGDVKHVFEDGDHPGFFPAAIIALGALVFIIAFFGCCGAIRESRKTKNLNCFQFHSQTKEFRFRMSLESLFAVLVGDRCLASSSRHLCLCLQPRHSASCFQGMGSIVGWTSSLCS